jgi:TolB-like protein
MIAALVVTTLLALDGGPEKATTSSVTTSPAAACKLAILRPTLLNFTAEDAYLADLVAEVLAVEIARTSSCEIVTEADIESMLAFEGQKQSLGCDADAPSCLSEIGDALGVDQVVTGSVTRAGDRFALSLRKVDVARARVEARAQVFSKPTPEALAVASREGVVSLVGDVAKSDVVLVDEASDPSALGPVLLFGGTGAAVLGGVLAVVGFGGGGVSYLLIQDQNGDGQIRYAATLAMVPLLVVGAVGVTLGIAGAAAIGGSFAF